jgi:hypothetical protein
LSAVATDADVINLTLQKCYVLIGGESAEADDFAAMQTVFDARMEYLRDAEICWWSVDEVPEGVKDSLAEYLTFFCPVIPQEERVQFERNSYRGLKEIQGLAQMRSDDSPIRVDYY